MRRMLLLTLLLVASHAAPAMDSATLPDPVQQQRYMDLIHELRCLKCQGETVADTPADFAKDIRRQVREMIMAGRSDAEIRQFFVERYGEVILLRPRSLLLWIAPGVLLALGVLVAVRIQRQRRQLLATDTSDPEAGEERA